LTSTDLAHEAEDDFVHGELPAFPKRGLMAIILATLMAILVIIGITHLSDNSRRDLNDHAVEVARSHGAIALEDEILTMSAKLAAATGDARWSQRYEQHSTLMDKALKRAASLAPSKAADRFVQSTSAANDELTGMERYAQDLARDGDTRTAVTILNSAEYEKQKAILTKGAEQFDAAIAQSIKAKQEALDRRSLWSDAARIGILALLVAGWWQFLRTLGRWRKAMAATIEREQEISLENRRQQKAINVASAQNQRVLQETVKRVENENSKLNAAARDQERLSNRRLADSFEAAIGNIANELAQLSEKLVGTAKTMDGAAQTAGAQFGEMTHAIRTSSEDMLAVASTTDQLVASVREAGGHASSSASHLIQATREAEGLIDRVVGVASSVQQIHRIVGMIDEIAKRTNMLALNASIEASRAGEAGKGFAVVAQEVKNLANQTAQATAEVSSLIGKVKAETDEAMKSGSITAASMENVQEAAQAIGVTLAQQQVAISELSARASSVVSSNANVTSGVKIVGETARKAGQVSGEVLDTAHMLARQTDKLRDQILLVLGRLRAA
jgi:methyl-accepting chemotaxis protein